MKKNLIHFAIVFSLCSVCENAFGQFDTEKIVEDEKRQFINLHKQNNSKVETSFFTTASANFDVIFYRCEWQIDPAVRFIRGKITSSFKILVPSDKIVYDLSDTLFVDSITYRGGQLGFQRLPGDGLQIQFPGILNAGQIDSLSIYYNGVPRNTVSTFINSSHGGIPVMYTQSEPYGGKEWWPCKNGLTDKADSIEIIIKSPAAFRGTTNGVLYNDEITGPDRTVYFKHHHPIASYLVGIAVTNYDVAVDSVQIGARQMPVIMNAYPEYKDYFANATYYAKQILPKFSSLFGDYPFADEHYAQTQWNPGGGMEHQTNSFIGSVWNQLVAHELGHHWFGDLVTCGSWQHIWLNEGFGNYMQFLYVQNFDTSLIIPHLKYYLNLVVSAPDGSVFVPDTSNPTRIFSGRLSYAKGGYVVHMLRGVLGDSIFFRGLRKYLNDPIVRNKFALTGDLERNLEEISGKDLHSFFQKWIYGEGYANYNCTWTQNNNDWAKVKINQTTSHPSVSFYDMPVQLRFKNNNRDTVITVDHLQNGQVFWLNIGFQADTMEVDPNYWILAKDRIVKKIPAETSIADLIKIYPNPAPDNINIAIFNPTTTYLDVQIYSIAGQLIYKAKKILTGQDEVVNIPVTLLSKGMYIVRITDSKHRVVSKKILR